MTLGFDVHLGYARVLKVMMLRNGLRIIMLGGCG